MTLLEETAAGKPGKRERLGGKVVVLVIVLLVAVAAGGYAAAHQVAGDKVPLGTTVSGVDIGGMSRADAIAELQEAFGARGAETIRVEVDPSTGSGTDADGSGTDGSATRSDDVRPDEIGLAVDYAATVDAAGAGDSWSPERQWDYFTGGGDLDAIVDVDESLLSERLAALSEGLGVPPENGRIEFEDGRISVVDPVPGEAVDTDAAEEAITAAFLGDEDAVQLTVTQSAPDIDEGDIQEALEGFANPALASAVTLQFGKSKVRLQPKQYADALSMVPEDGELVPRIDARRITRLVKGATSSGEPVDATVRLVDGEPKVIPAKPGVEFEPDDVVAVFTDLLVAPEGERTGEVEATVRAADFTTKEAKALGIKRKVSGFTTYYPHADYRNVNIGRAAELVDGTILKPGETFSLNGIVGERTAENGFTIGYVISNGVLVQDYGGGVSQMATTTFNAMFFAGLEDVEHKPHSFFIDRYPEGREATVAWPDLDLQFRNDTDYGVLIHATVTPSTYSTQGVVNVEMYSTKVWDIESITSERYNYRAPGTRYLTTPDCEPFTGYSGFDVDVTRVFREHGEDEIHHTEDFHTAYTAADTVVCGPPPQADPPADD